MRYTTSKISLTDEQVAAVACKYEIEPWTKAGDERFYLNLDALGDLIGLDQSFYKNGSCSGCSYVDDEGDEVTVAHSRCYGRGQFGCRTFISGGTIYSDWMPYGANIAELVAMRIAERF